MCLKQWTNQNFFQQSKPLLSKVQQDLNVLENQMVKGLKFSETLVAQPTMTQGEKLQFNDHNSQGTQNRFSSMAFNKIKFQGINLKQVQQSNEQFKNENIKQSHLDINQQQPNKSTFAKSIMSLDYIENEEKIKSSSMIVPENDIQSQVQVKESQLILSPQDNTFNQINDSINNAPTPISEVIKKPSAVTKSILKIKTLPKLTINNSQDNNNSQINNDTPIILTQKQSQDNNSNNGRFRRQDSPVGKRGKSNSSPIAHRNQGDIPIFNWDIIKAREVVFPTNNEQDALTVHQNELSQVFGDNLSIYNSILDQNKSKTSFGSSNTFNRQDSLTTSYKHDDASSVNSNSQSSASSHLKSGSNFNETTQLESLNKRSKALKKSNLDSPSFNGKQLDKQDDMPKGSQDGNQHKQLKKQTNEDFLKQPIEYEYSQIIKHQINNILQKGSNKIKLQWSTDEVLQQSKQNKQPQTISVLLKSLNYNNQSMEQNEGGIQGLVNAFRRRVKMIVNSSLYENLIMICVVINTIILSLDGSTTESDIFDKFNEAFTYIFAIDMGLKLIGLGVPTYVADKMNIFDSIIVALSIFDMIFLTGTKGGSSFSAFRSVRILRVFRVLRVTRLLRQLMFMKILIQVISSIIDKLVYILLLLVLYIFIYTLIGMQLYGGQFLSVSRDNRMTFDSFLEASFSVYDILTIENWNTILQVALRTNVSMGVTCAYLISCIFIGNFIIMNLVLATMIGAFNSGQFEKEKKEISNTVEIIEDLSLNHTNTMNSTTFLNLSNSQLGSGSRLGFSQNSLNKIQSNHHHHSQTSSANQSEENSFTDNNTSHSGSKKKQSNKHKNKDSNSVENKEKDGGSSVSDSQHQNQNNRNEENQNNDQEDQIKHKEQNTVEKNIFKEKKQQNDDKEQILNFFDKIECKRSLYIFSMENRFRRMCYQIVKHPLFENIVLMGIILNSLKLVYDTYITAHKSKDDVEKQVSSIFDILFSIFFAVESIIKIISYGFILDENSYLRDTWSQLDFFVVVTSIVDVSYEDANLAAIKILRLLRTLRPLRILHHNKNMKLIVTTLLESMAGILNMILVLFLVWLMFAILGVSLMKGKLKYCNFPNRDIKYNIYQYNQQQCNDLQGTWSTYDLNFDNVLNALLTLFIFSTFEGWPVYSWNFIDASSDGPQLFNSSYFAFYIVVFILVGSFFSIDLFGAVLAFHYDIALKKSKNKYLSDEQAQWIELQRLILKSKPDYSSISSPSNKIIKIIWTICESSYLEIFIMCCIIGNIIAMSLSYDTSPQQYDDTLQNINLAFSSVFILECILKLIAYGVNGYFFKSSNQFDFFVVSVSIIDIVFTYSGKSIIKFLSQGPQIARIFRVFRVTRLLRLVKQFEGLQKLLQTLIFALPSLANATALLLLIYFIFSILACFLYSSYEIGNSLDSFQNFSNFHRSYLLLFRLSTGEDWHIVMFDIIHKTNVWSCAFFILFIVAQQFIMMNLFVLIIIEQFEQNYINPDNPLNDFKYSEEDFKKQWVLFTRENYGAKIHERFVTDFYFSTMRPLGFEGYKFLLICLQNNYKHSQYETISFYFFKGLYYYRNQIIIFSYLFIIQIDYKNKLKDFIEQVKTLNKDVGAQDLELITGKYRIKQKQIAEKEIMQMNIRCDYDGFIYFNELLYYFFKSSLYNSVFERIERAQTPIELEKCIKAEEILLREEKITYKKLRIIKKKQASLTRQKFVSKRQKDVNPMVRRLFVGMCFNSWLKYSQNIQKNIQNMDNDDISSKTDSDEDRDSEFNPNELDKLQAIDKLYENNDDENIIQVRGLKQRNQIIPREHTILLRRSNKNNENNEIRKRNSTQQNIPFFNGKYMIIPNAEDAYKQDYDDDNYQPFLEIIQQQQLEERENMRLSRKNTNPFMNSSIRQSAQIGIQNTKNSIRTPQNIQSMNTSQRMLNLSKIISKRSESDNSQSNSNSQNLKQNSEIIQNNINNIQSIRNYIDPIDSVKNNSQTINDIYNSPRQLINMTTEYIGTNRAMISPASNSNLTLSPKGDNQYYNNSEYVNNNFSQIQATPVLFNSMNSRNFLCSAEQSLIQNDINSDIENKLGFSINSIRQNLKSNNINLNDFNINSNNCSPRRKESDQLEQFSMLSNK